MNRRSASRLTIQERWFRYWMPYTFSQLEVMGQSHVYLPLNRNYNPLGVWSRRGAPIDYRKYSDQALVFPSDPRKFEGVWYKQTLYLYEDDPNSRLDYFERLERLMSRSVNLLPMVMPWLDWPNSRNNLAG
jgi:hypothetical protein